MKTAEYIGLDGKKFKVEYDENASCISCGLTVIEASMGGTVLCPWCDCGEFRDGTKWNYQETVNKELVRKKAKEIEGIMKSKEGIK